MRGADMTIVSVSLRRKRALTGATILALVGLFAAAPLAHAQMISLRGAAQGALDCTPPDPFTTTFVPAGLLEAPFPILPS
jgi:hypothetical protein